MHASSDLGLSKKCPTEAIELKVYGLESYRALIHDPRSYSSVIFPLIIRKW